MKGVVLAAGLGTRLRPLTFIVPKPLVTIGTTPIIDLVIRWLKMNGVGEVIVVGGYMQDVLERYLRSEHPDVTFVPSRRLLGTAGQLYYARDLVDGDVVVANCDVLTNLDLSAPIELHRSTGADLTVVARRTRHALRFGALELEGTRLARWVEKPAFEVVTSVGIYIMRSDVVKGLREEPLDMDALARSLPNVHVYVARNADFFDVGTLDDLADVSGRDVQALLGVLKQ